jgi:hypothetical protein
MSHPPRVLRASAACAAKLESCNIPDSITNIFIFTLINERMRDTSPYERVRALEIQERASYRERGRTQI